MPLARPESFAVWLWHPGRADSDDNAARRKRSTGSFGLVASCSRSDLDVASGFSAGVDGVLKGAGLSRISEPWQCRLMKLRLVAHCLVLGLFVTGTILAAFVSPAAAGFGRANAVEMAMPMDGAMPCCPTDQGNAKDCTTNCPALSFCLAKCFASEPASFVMLARPIVAEPELAADDAINRSRPFEPPARPPRI